MFKSLIGGAYVGYPPWGGPPGDPTAPPGVPGCHRAPEKIVKILKYYLKFYIHQNAPNFNSKGSYPIKKR